MASCTPTALAASAGLCSALQQPAGITRCEPHRVRHFTLLLPRSQTGCHSRHRQAPTMQTTCRFPGTTHLRRSLAVRRDAGGSFPIGSAEPRPPESPICTVAVLSLLSACYEDLHDPISHTLLLHTRCWWHLETRHAKSITLVAICTPIPPARRSILKNMNVF